MPDETSKLVLTKKPKGVKIIEGFPGFGLVSTITTGFIIDHLKCELIGKCHFENVPPTLAIHGCKIMDPVGIFYNKQHNLVIIHAITAPQNIEWQATEIIVDLCEQLQAEELIALEGVGSVEESTRAFFYSEDEKTKKKFKQMGIDCLGEGIIVGVTAGVMQKYKGKLTCLFAEAHSKLPDSKAAAKIIETLDKYLQLKVDYEPLLEQAKQFEEKLKSVMEQAGQAQEEKNKRDLSYLG